MSDLSTEGTPVQDNNEATIQPRANEVKVTSANASLVMVALLTELRDLNKKILEALNVRPE